MSAIQIWELPMATMFSSKSGWNLIRGPSIDDASHQVSVHLTKRFQRRFKSERLTDDGCQLFQYFGAIWSWSYSSWDLSLPMQSVHITTKASSNPDQARCTRYNAIKFVSKKRILYMDRSHRNGSYNPSSRQAYNDQNYQEQNFSLSW